MMGVFVGIVAGRECAVGVIVEANWVRVALHYFVLSSIETDVSATWSITISFEADSL